MKDGTLPTNKKTAVAVRCLVVGAPRSGTTLLQARLAAHPALVTFPETHFFEAATKNRNRFQRRLDLLNPDFRGYAEKFISEICRQCGQDPVSLLPDLRGFRVSGYTRRFFAVLDEIVRRQAGVGGWIEKTPDHVRYIARLERAVPAVRFVHMIRSGVSVVGSLYEVTRKYPESWGGPWSIARCVQTWNDDVSRSLVHYRQPHHLLIRYEDFVGSPKQHVNAIWRFLRLPEHVFDPGEPVRGEPRFIESFEKWKSDAAGPVMKRRHRRIDDLFAPETIAGVRKSLQFGGEVPQRYFSRID